MCVWGKYRSPTQPSIKTNLPGQEGCRLDSVRQCHPCCVYILAGCIWHIFSIQTKPSWLTKCMKRFWSFIQQKYILFKSNWMLAKYNLNTQYWFIKEARPANWIIRCFNTLLALSKQITGLVSGHDCGIQLISDTHHNPPPSPTMSSRVCCMLRGAWPNSRECPSVRQENVVIIFTMYNYRKITRK